VVAGLLLVTVRLWGQTPPTAPRTPAIPPYQRQATFAQALAQCRELLDRYGAAINADLKLPKGGERERAERQLSRCLYNNFPQETDWLMQDWGPDLSVLFGAGDGAAALAQCWTKAVAELPASAQDGRHAQWRASADWAAKLAVYFDVCQARRALRLQSLVRRAPEWVFVKNVALTPSLFAYTEALTDHMDEFNFREGGALCRLRLGADAVAVEPWLESATGRLRDVDVGFDGKTILFAWKKDRQADDYSVFEMDAATRAVRQVTPDGQVADYEGIYLPDGRIMFSSTRCIQTVDCFRTEVSNLYVCERDGSGLRRVGYDQVHTVCPQVLPSGKVVYTRWEYNDRGQIYPQPLFQMNPDGTGQTEYYGNNSWFPTSILHARGLPGSDQLIAVLSGHHTWAAGKLALLDRRAGNQECAGVQLICPPRPCEPVKVDQYGQAGDLFCYPWAVSADEFVVSYHPLGRDLAWSEQLAKGLAVPRFGLYWFHASGRRELLVTDAKFSCVQAVPLAPRPLPHRIPATAAADGNRGRYFLQDIHAGPGLAGVARGTITRLRVIALEYRPVWLGGNYNNNPQIKDPPMHAFVSTPISCVNGCWDVKRVVGEATVYPDGSAFFEAPANTPLYFQAIDQDGYAAQTMRSWSTLMPGETFGCVGCHETKTTAPPLNRRPPQALRAGSQPLMPVAGVPDAGFSYPQVVQPILDRHCVTCHGGAAPAAQPDLRGQPVAHAGAKRKWSASYQALTRDPFGKLTNWVHPQSAPPLQAPYTAGAATSGLMKMLAAGHGKTRLTEAELGVLALWLDLGVPYCGTYDEANTWTDTERAKYDYYVNKRRQYATPGEWAGRYER
jgi:hypothetical protein